MKVSWSRHPYCWALLYLCFSWRKSFNREISANAVSRTWSWRNLTPLRYECTNGFLHEYFIRHIWHDLWYPLSISQLDLDCRNICHSSSIWARFSRCWSLWLSLYNSAAKLLFFGCLKWHDKCCSPITFTQGLCNPDGCSELIHWFSPVCVCICSIRKSWRSWGLRPSRCALGWAVSGCPLPGLQFICWTLSAALEGWTAQIQTQTRV